MLQIVVVNQLGEESIIEVFVGCILMEVICDNGFDELLVLCGGCCFCVICYVYIDLLFMDKILVMSEDENDLFDSLDYCNEYLCLLCQVLVIDVFDGLCVMIVQED